LQSIWRWRTVACHVPVFAKTRFWLVDWRKLVPLMSASNNCRRQTQIDRQTPRVTHLKSLNLGDLMIRQLFLRQKQQSGNHRLLFVAFQFLSSCVAELQFLNASCAQKHLKNTDGMCHDQSLFRISVKFCLVIQNAEWTIQRHVVLTSSDQSRHFMLSSHLSPWQSVAWEGASAAFQWTLQLTTVGC